MKNFSYKSLFIILFFLLIAIVILWKFILPNQKVSAAWFNDSWMYRKAVSITNTSGSNLTDFQVSLSIGTSALINAGKMKSDCSDIRITDNTGKLLNFWIEENNPGCNTPTDTKIWLKAPSLPPTSGATVFVYYGNPSATTTQSGDNTFEFFDDFNNGAIDSNKWQTDSGTLTETSSSPGYIYENSSTALNFLVSKNYTFTNGIMETRTSGTRTGGSGDPDNDNAIIWRYQDTNNFYFVHDDFANPGGTTVCDPPCDEVQSRKRQAGAYSGGVWIDNPTLDEENHWYNFKITATGSNFNIYYSKIGTTNVWSDATWASGKIGLGSFYNEESARFDYVFVRKYASTDPTSSLQSEELSPAPIAYWKFDEGIGTTAYDSTSSRNNGTITGATWKTEDQCISGKCLKFNGTGNVNMGNPSNNLYNFGTGNFTLNVWFKASIVGSSGCISNPIFLKGDLSSTSYALGIDWGSMRFWANGTAIGYGYVDDKKWHHIVAVRTQTQLLLYDNGILQAQTNSTPTNISNTDWLGIGKPYCAGSANGFIDEPKIYPYSRTPAQIKQDYNSGKSHASSSKGSSVNLGSSNKSGEFLSDGLVGYWKMDENTGTSLVDNSGNGNNATFFGSPSWSSGKFGSGVNNGNTISDFIDAPNVSIGTSWTASAWFLYPLTSTGSGWWTLFRSNVNDHQVIVQRSDSQLGMYDNASGTGFRGTGYLMTSLANGWHQIAVTGSGGSQKFYIDGNYVGQADKQSISDIKAIGNYQGGSQNWGTIDEVRIYNRALSPSEVSQLYNWAPSPIGYWDFNENTGTIVNDKSGIGNTGVWNGSGSHWTNGKYGSAGNFNGSNDNVNLGTTILNNVNSGTINMWINPISAAANGGQPWLNTTMLSNDNIYLGIQILSDRKIRAYYWNTDSTPKTLDTINSVNFNSWNYITYSWDSTGSKIYINGILENSSNTLTWTNVHSGHLNQPNYIGSTNGGSYFFNGKIDDVKIYNYARTQKQITEDMNAGHPAAGSPVGSQVGYYKFDEGYGTSTANWGNGGTTLNGTLSGTTIPTWSNDGKFSKALNFSTNQYVYYSPFFLENTREITLSAWVKPTSYTYIFQYGSSNSYNGYINYFAVYSDGSLTIDIEDAITAAHFTPSSNNGDVPMNQWSYVAAVVGPNNVYFYVNGRLTKTSSSFNGMYPLHNANTSYNNIGRFYYNSGNISYSSGVIDEVKVYNYALTTDEIKLDYNRNSALQLGSLSSGTGNTSPSTSGSQEYCIPGDTVNCSSPVGEWKMDEKTGSNIFDTSGNGYTGVATYTTWTQGKIGSALNFNGSSSKVSVGTLTGKYSSALTVEAWVNHQSGSGWTDIVAGGCGDILFGFVDNNFYFGGQCNNPFVVIGYIANINNAWHHVAGTYNGSTARIYVDGKEVNNSSKSGSFTPGALYLGSAGSSEYFTGKLDQVRIYNYARTPAQIAWDYNKGGPVGHWKFDECQGGTVFNSAADPATAGLGSTGTIVIGATGTQNSLGTCTIGTSAAWTNGATGKYNGSLNFDGVDDYVNYGNINYDYTNFTVSLWTKAVSSTQTHVKNLIGKGDWNSNNNWYLGYRNGTTLSFVYGIPWGSGPSYPINSFDLTQWHHIVGIATDSNQYLYIDGKLVNSITASHTTVTNAYNLEVARSSYYGNFFNGQIDNVRIYNYALTAAQVKTLFNNGAVNFN